MDNLKVIYKVGIVAALALNISGCRPAYDEIDNDTVISKPYVLYVGDSSGTIYKTNDGLSYQIVSGADNYPASAIVTSGKNLLFIKKNLHIIEDLGSGNNSNPSFLNPGFFTQYKESIIITVPKLNNRIYLGGTGIKGYRYNDSNGRPGINYVNWRDQADPLIPSGTVFTSFAMLDNGDVIALDANTRTTFRLNYTNSTWAPTSGGTLLPAGGQFFLSHMGDVLLAADATGTNGVYYSSNGGNTWQQYSGLPTGLKIESMCAPFGQTVLIGTHGKGIYRLPLGSTQFVPASLGLPANAIIPSITDKYDFYKNNESKQYVYAATNQGLYRSQDLGENWVKVYDGPNGKGNYTVLY